jgi:hypothetical protein
MVMRDYGTQYVLGSIFMYVIIVVCVMCAVLLIVDRQRFREHFNRAKTTYNLVKGYVSVLIRTKVNKIFGFVNVNVLSGSRYHLTYTLPSGDIYTIAFTKKRIGRVETVSNSEGDDVTREFLRFLGPGNNFYGIPTSPAMISMSPITVNYVDGTSQTYNSSDTIRV